MYNINKTDELIKSKPLHSLFLFHRLSSNQPETPRQPPSTDPRKPQTLFRATLQARQPCEAFAHRLPKNAHTPSERFCRRADSHWKNNEYPSRRSPSEEGVCAFYSAEALVSNRATYGRGYVRYISSRAQSGGFYPLKLLIGNASAIACPPAALKWM